MSGITATLLLAFAEDLAKAAIAGAVIGGYPGRELLEVATIHMVPMVDPDGVDLVTGAQPADSGDYAFARSLFLLPAFLPQRLESKSPGG